MSQQEILNFLAKNKGWHCIDNMVTSCSEVARKKNIKQLRKFSLIGYRVVYNGKRQKMQYCLK